VAGRRDTVLKLITTTSDREGEGQRRLEKAGQHSRQSCFGAAGQPKKMKEKGWVVITLPGRLFLNIFHVTKQKKM